MVVTADLVISAFRAGIRVYGAANRALAQKLRDRAMVPPGATPPTFQGTTSIEEIVNEHEDNEEFREWVEKRDLREVFDAMRDDPLAHTRMAEELSLYARARGAQDIASELAKITEHQASEIEQWIDEEDRPVAPWVRFGLVLADVAAEFAAGNTRLITTDPNAEKLVGAFAGSISRLIPDDEKFGLQQDVGSRLMAVVLQAGLETIAANQELLLDDEKVRQLVDGTLQPVIGAFPKEGNLAQRLEWQEIAEAVMGPAASAAFRIVAADPVGFLGDRFDTKELVGALTQQLFSAIAEEGLDDTLTRDGLVALYTGSLRLIAQRPELVLDSAGSPRAEFFGALLSDVAGVLANDPLEFDRALGVRLARTALETFAMHSAAILRLGDESWEKVAIRALDQVLRGLAAGLGDRKKLERLFGQDQLVELTRVVLGEVARTPEMLAAESRELETIIAAIASAMSKDESLLLSGDDWLEIVGVALSEAARSPGRLFGFDNTASPERELGARILTALFDEAAREVGRGRASGVVLFGETLRSAAIAALRVVAGDPARAAAALEVPAPGAEDLVTALIRQVSQAVELRDAAGFHMGAKEWLRLFRVLLPNVIVSQEVPVLVRNGALTGEGRALVDSILSNPSLLRSP